MSWQTTFLLLADFHLPQTLTFNLHIFSEGIKKITGYPYVYVMLCFVFSFNYNGLRPKAYLSSLCYFLFPLCLLFCQADVTAPSSPMQIEAFPQHGKHNLTEPSALSRTHIPEASTVHQTKAVGHVDVNHSLRFLQYQTH